MCSGKYLHEIEKERKYKLYLYGCMLYTSWPEVIAKTFIMQNTKLKQRRDIQ